MTIRFLFWCAFFVAFALGQAANGAEPAGADSPQPAAAAPAESTPTAPDSLTEAEVISYYRALLDKYFTPELLTVPPQSDAQSDLARLDALDAAEKAKDAEYEASGVNKKMEDLWRSLSPALEEIYALIYRTSRACYEARFELVGRINPDELPEGKRGAFYVRKFNILKERFLTHYYAPWEVKLYYSRLTDEADRERWRTEFGSLLAEPGPEEKEADRANLLALEEILDRVSDYYPNATSEDSPVEDVFRYADMRLLFFVKYHEPIETLGSTVDDLIRLNQKHPWTASENLHGLFFEIRILRSELDKAFPALERFAESYVDSGDEELAKQARKYLRSFQFYRLPGKELDFCGITIDGTRYQLSEHRGKLVHVWVCMVGCGPCLKEIKPMSELLAKYGDRGFEVVEIFFNDAESVKELRTRHAVPWPMLCDKLAKEAGLPLLSEEYSIHFTPTTILVGRDGKVIDVNLRSNDIKDKMDALLAE